MSEKVVITSALPYANGEIHLGHVVSTYLPADIFARFCRMRGREVAFTCATDDFGTPILLRAEKEGKKPEDYVAYWKDRDERDLKDAGIDFNFFHNTSSRENIELVQYFFTKLHENNLIYAKQITQPYCEQDEKFLPDRYVVGACPYCGAKNQYSDGCENCGRAFTQAEILDPRCSICGRVPVERSSTHYFFRLSVFSPRLREWLSGNENLQGEIKNYVLRWIDDGLRDWDITRDIPWGVPIPLSDAKGKVLYGWFDNHICYISTTMLYLERKGIGGKAFWNSSDVYHFIGKDIVYHHYLFLPAMRMGLEEEYKLPDFIPARGHLMLHGEKFSKSRGWYIGLREFLDAFPADYLRYYFSRITSYDQRDVNFDWNDFEAKINNELVANIGNFVHRTLSFVDSRYGGIVPEHDEFDESDRRLVDRMEAIAKEVTSFLDENEQDKGIRSILEFSSDCNQYFQRKAPWTENSNRATTIFLCVNAVNTLAILLSPYLPFSTKKLIEQMNLKQVPWDYSGKIVVPAGHRIGKPSILFRKVEAGEIARMKNLLGKAAA